MAEIPIFPLNTVLFPRTPLQLHIFEDRYKQMVAHCQHTGSPFGISLIRKGLEVGGEAEPYAIGCTAEIVHTQPLDHGTMNIIIVGQERYFLQSITQHEPYLIGDIVVAPVVVQNSEALEEPNRRLHILLERYLALLSKDTKYEAVISQFPQDPLSFGYLAAMILQIPPTMKQGLLQIDSALELLETLEIAYQREVTMVKVMLKEKDELKEIPFSKN